MPPPPSAISTNQTSSQAVASCLTQNSVPPPSPRLAELDPSKLRVTITKNPRTYNSDASTIEWGKTDVTTDHWITAKWSDSEGWEAPKLEPYGPIDLWPTASCLHYATECFEGMKAYRGYDGSVRLFRPSRNTARMLMSSMRIALPSFPPSALEELIKVLVSHDAPKWLPKPGSFMYIRPTMIGTGGALGIQKPREAMLFILAAQFPVLYEKPMKLFASREGTIRAWPGGFGFAKVGANYGPSLMAQKEAQTRGYDQILWLFDKSCQVTEAGASNFFVVWKCKESGRVQLVTAPLDDKIILDGVTRRSVLELARERLTRVGGAFEPLEVVERKLTMFELVDAASEGRLLETFAVGTAFFVTSVTAIHFRNKDILPQEADGKYTSLIRTWLKNITFGKEAHEWAMVVPETGFTVDPQADCKEVDDIATKLRELKRSAGFGAALQRVMAEI